MRRAAVFVARCITALSSVRSTNRQRIVRYSSGACGQRDRGYLPAVLFRSSVLDTAKNMAKLV